MTTPSPSRPALAALCAGALLAEAHEQYDEIQRELSVLANVLQEVE